MEDRTRLELDIEERERHSTPASVKVLIAFLVIAVCVMGIFTFNVRKQLLAKEREMIVLQESYRQEKVELLSRIKILESGNAPMEPNKSEMSD